jgi:hypothetical protein
MSVPTRRPWPAPAIALGLGLALAHAGCDQPTGSTRPRTRAPQAEVVEQPAPAPEPAPAPAPVAPRPILGQKTQDIRDMSKEQKAGGVVVEPKITAKDPITLQGNAYVSIIGQNSILNIKHALDLYQAETGEFPKTYAEFMEKIIKANNIVLPTLPFYQEYGYDAPNHKLVIMEYPDRKEAANYPK